jgi:hypothetical protein
MRNRNVYGLYLGIRNLAHRKTINLPTAIVHNVVCKSSVTK